MDSESLTGLSIPWPASHGDLRSARCRRGAPIRRFVPRPEASVALQAAFNRAGADGSFFPFRGTSLGIRFLESGRVLSTRAYFTQQRPIHNHHEKNKAETAVTGH